MIDKSFVFINSNYVFLNHHGQTDKETDSNIQADRQTTRQTNKRIDSKSDSKSERQLKKKPHLFGELSRAYDIDIFCF
jgi:hypothetical protein